MEALPRDDVRLHLVADALRRQLIVILLVTVAVTGAVAAYALHKPKAYTASAKVLLRPLPGNPLAPTSTTSSQSLTVAMDTEAGIVSSPSVTQLVVDKLKVPITAGTKNLIATVPPNTEIVLITYKAPTAALAEAGAEGFAESFLAYRATQATATQKTQLASLESQLKAANAGLDKASAAASSTNPPADASAQVQLYTNRLASIQDSIGALQIVATDSGTVVSPATKPTSPSGLPALFLIIAAGIAGLTCGLSLGIWRERRDDHIRTAAETSVEDLPVLAQLPALTAQPRILGDASAGDAIYDAYRRSRAGVIALSARPSMIVVSATDRFQPVDEIAVNLSLSLTSAGYRVTLVDATLGQGDVAGILGVRSGDGLADALVADNTSKPDLIQTRDLRLLRSGRNPEAAREYFSSARLGTLMAHLSLDSDYVIVAAPAASTNDGNAVAVVADSVVLVVEDKHTTHREVSDIVQRSRRLGVSLLGVLSVTPSGRRARRKSRSRGPQSQARVSALPAGPTGSSTPDTSRADSSEASAAEPLARTSGRRPFDGS